MYLPDVLCSTGKSQFVKSVSALQLSHFPCCQASFLLMILVICLWGQKDTVRNPDLLSMVNLATHLSENLWTKIMVLFHSITWKIKPISRDAAQQFQCHYYRKKKSQKQSQKKALLTVQFSACSSCPLLSYLGGLADMWFNVIDG